MSKEQESGYTTCPFANLLGTTNKDGSLSYPEALDFDISSFLNTPNDDVVVNTVGLKPNPADHMSQGMSRSAERSINPFAHRNPTSSRDERNGCDCMTHHATLLLQLSNLKNDKGLLSLDDVLLSVQQALTPWNHLNECAMCESDDDQGVLIFSAMTIRTVLALLQRFCAESIYLHKGDERSAIASSAQLLDGNQITVGRYKVSPEEHGLVTSLLITRALSNIRSVLVTLKVKLDRSTKRIKGDYLKKNGGDNLVNGNNQEEAPSTESNVVPKGEEGGCIQILLRSLDATVEEIGKTVPKMGFSALSQTNPFAY